MAQTACPTNPSITSGKPTPSARAEKFSAIRCRSTGWASTATSSRLGASRPSNTARASLALYNTREEIDVLAGGLRRVLEVFR